MRVHLARRFNSAEELRLLGMTQCGRRRVPVERLVHDMDDATCRACLGQEVMLARRRLVRLNQRLAAITEEV